MKHLFGNTYPIKEQIKKAGGKWDAAYGAWKVPKEKYQELFNLIPQKLFESNNGNWNCCADCQRSNRYLDKSGYCLNCKQKRESNGEDVEAFKLTGQLWEECPVCDQEPMYMSHGVCECCARKGYRR